MSYKILIVDDLDTNRELVCKLLANHNTEFKVLEASDGKEGYEVALKEKPDLILLDLIMPEYDGLDGIKMLQGDEKTKHIPIIVLTAYKSTENLKESFELGAFDYLSKPLNLDELDSRVIRALDIAKNLKKYQDSAKKYKSQASEFENVALFAGSAQQSFLVIDTDGKLEWANKGFETIHGYTFNEFILKYGNTIFSLGNDPSIYTRFNECLSKKKPIEFTTNIEVKSGKTKWIQTFITPKLNPNGKIDKIIAIELDITNFKKKEEELQKQNEKMQVVMQNLENANKLLEQQKEEINDQKQLIQEEQGKSEKILLNIFPFEIARQLKSKGKAGTRQYKLVSVMFADFKEFSKRSKELEPKELVNILDTYFAKFDSIIGNHYMEKIKTIGDAYMCAGGLPLSNKSNPLDAVLAGLEIQGFMNRLNDERVLENLPVWELRIGVHTGSVIAGVVGRKKFAYDIWGETVNVASRMQAAGHVGMVNISETTYKYVKEYFDCDYRGKIEAKNIGKIDMYFVNRLKKEFSKDVLGYIPNNHFINIKNKL